jgi:hypothetical protein
VKDLANEFLNAKQALMDAGELSPRTWGEYKAVCDLIVQSFGVSRLVSDLRPEDFAALRNQIAKRWGPVRLDNAIQRVQSVFKLAADNDLIDRRVRFGQGFARPSAKPRRRDDDGQAIHRVPGGAAGDGRLGECRLDRGQLHRRGSP